MAGNITDDLAVAPSEIDDWHHAVVGAPWGVLRRYSDGSWRLAQEFPTEAEATAYAEAAAATCVSGELSSSPVPSHLKSREAAGQDSESLLTFVEPRHQPLGPLQES